MPGFPYVSYKTRKAEQGLGLQAPPIALFDFLVDPDCQGTGLPGKGINLVSVSHRGRLICSDKWQLNLMRKVTCLSSIPC